MDWMYKNSDSVDPEEYLLGKAIDKNFERRGTPSENTEKDVLPPSIFASSGSNLQVDVFRKVKEDPLEQIKQKEIEMRKQLLKNPVKLKKLQNLLKAKEKENAQKEKKKKKKNSKDIDALLVAKYSKLIRKYGAKQLMELTNPSSESEEDEDSPKGKKGRTKANIRDFDNNLTTSGDSSSSSESDVPRRDRDRTKSSSRTRRESKVTESVRMQYREDKSKYRQRYNDSSDESLPRKHEKRKNQSTDEDNGRRKVVKKTEDRRLESEPGRRHQRNAERCRHSSSSSSTDSDDQGAVSDVRDVHRLKSKFDDDDEERPSQKSYGLVLPKSFDASKAASSSGQDDSWRKRRDIELETKKKAEAEKKAEYLSRKKQHGKPAKLSQEEKEAKLREMMANGQQREKERKKNVTRYKMEDRKEESQTKYEDKDFIRKQLSKLASKSVEDRIKSNAYRIQRSQSSMEQHFTSRH